MILWTVRVIVCVRVINILQININFIQTKNGSEPLSVILRVFILIYFHADSAADVNSNPQNTNQSDTTRKRSAKDASHKVVEKQKRTSTSNPTNETQQIKGIFG